MHMCLCVCRCCISCTCVCVSIYACERMCMYMHRHCFATRTGIDAAQAHLFKRVEQAAGETRIILLVLNPRFTVGHTYTTALVRPVGLTGSSCFRKRREHFLGANVAVCLFVPFPGNCCGRNTMINVRICFERMYLWTHMFMGVYIYVPMRARARVCSEGETRMFEGSICPMCVRFGVGYD